MRLLPVGRTALAWALPLAIVLAIGTGNAAWGQAKKYANGHLLVETEWLRQHLNDPDIRIVDMRSEQDYLKGHIPGALNIRVTEIIAVRGGVRGMAAPMAELESTFSRLGIDGRTRVIAYDSSRSLLAARLFWTLEYLGHSGASVLNGGWDKWLKEGGPTTREIPKVAPRRFSAHPTAEKLARADWILSHLKDDGKVILDARSPAEFEGKVVRSSRGGRIPGAVNIEWKESMRLDGSSAFKDAEALQLMFERAGITKDREAITMCQTGFRAAHSYFVLRLLGYPRVRMYDGSWEEWGNNPELPVEVGRGRKD